MRLNYSTTKELIELLLLGPASDARTRLHQSLRTLEANEAEFYVGIVEHAPGMRLSSQQWYELLSRLPNRILRSQLDLQKFLASDQIDRLPPEQG